MKFVIDQLATSLGRRDEVPNKGLARRLAESKDRAAIREIAAHLASDDKNIQSDCVKVLSEIGALDPKLVAPFAEQLVALLRNRNNRLVWGGMSALATIASIEAKALYANRETIQRAIENGSVITRDNGIKTLARVAAHSAAYRRELFPYLLDHLRNCRSQDVPQHAEHTAAAVDTGNRREFVKLLEKRALAMPASRLARIKRVIRSVG